MKQYRSTRLPLSLTITALAASSLCPPPSWAQSRPTPTEQRLPEVEVTDTLPAESPTERDQGYKAGRSATATGLALKPRDTPQAISTITHSQLKDFGLATVNDALAVAPGITVEKVETDRTYYSARGFDVDNFQLDGVGMPFTNGAQWGDVDTIVYDHIDVLRGANGLMTGVGQPSATVNFVRKKPTTGFQASGAFTLGSWQRKRVEADVSGSLKADESVRGRLVVAGEDGDSYLDRYGKTKRVLYGTVEVDLGPATMLTLGLLYQNNHARSPMWGALPMSYSDGTQTSYAESTSTAPDWAYWDNSDQRLHAELAHSFANGWALRTTWTHREMASESELLYLYGTPERGTETGLKIYPSAFDARYKQDLLNAQASGAFKLLGRQHEVAIGGSWTSETAKEHSGYSNVTGNAFNANLITWNGQYVKPSFDASTNGSAFSTSGLATFGSVRWNLDDAFKLITGARVTQIASRGQNYGVPHGYAHTRATPYLGAVLDVDASTSVYASATSIFKPQTETDSQRQVLPPVQGSNLEIGLKSELLDKALTAQVAVFSTRQKDLADNPRYLNGQTVYDTIDARSRGIGAELAGRISQRLDVTGSITHMRLKDETGKDARTFLPRDTVRLGLRFKPTDKLAATAALRWQSAIKDDDTVVRQGAYALLDVGASYQISPKLQAAAQVRNVGNKRYINSLYWDQSYCGAPRHGQLSLTWTY